MTDGHDESKDDGDRVKQLLQTNTSQCAWP